MSYGYSKDQVYVDAINIYENEAMQKPKHRILLSNSCHAEVFVQCSNDSYRHTHPLLYNDPE